MRSRRDRTPASRARFGAGGEGGTSSANAAQDTLPTDRSERNVLLATAFMAAAEVCGLAWLLY